MKSQRQTEMKEMNMTTQLINEATYNALTQLAVEFRTPEMQEQIEAYKAANSLKVGAEEHAPEAPVEPAEAVVEVTDTNTQPLVKDAANDEPEAPVESVDEQLQAVMDAKQQVRSQLLPDFKDQAIADFHLVASVAECFAENRVHTVAYEVPEALQGQFNKTNAYLSFKSITTTDLSSREIKNEQAKKAWATVCTNYKLQSTGKFRTTDADKKLKIGSQIITFSTALKFEHNPDNYLGSVVVGFELESLADKKTEVDTWLDIDIDEARMQQKRWYAHNKEAVLDTLDDMDAYKPARLSKEKFERYKLLLAIAKAWGEEHFNNVKVVIETLALTSGKTENEKFAEALKEAICSLQSNFVTPLENLPSDSLIEQLKDNKFSCSRQTLPTYLKDIGIEANARHQISFFGNTVQGYKLSVLEDALKPFELKPEVAEAA